MFKKRNPKHRYSQVEEEALLKMFTDEEWDEYSALTLGYGLTGAAANLSRINELRNTAFSRLYSYETIFIGGRYVTL